MKILMINVDCGLGSTGRICTDLAEELEKLNHEVKIAYGRDCNPKYEKYAVRVGNTVDVYKHVVESRLFDKVGFASKYVTKKFINWVKDYDPDVIHLHNIHGYYINVEILFNYLKACGKRIIWTLHDCWAFTGHCAFCQMDFCEKWKYGCGSCQIFKSEYPKSFLDKSKTNWIKKKNAFLGVENLTIITPSNWLAEKVKKSYLGNYKISVINNGIDTTIFKPTENDIRNRFAIKNKKIILGVASVWDQRKGLADFIELNQMLDSNYQIVLVGLKKAEIKQLPNGIIGIEKTSGAKELAEWYSAADIFVNPTHEDNYPTTNLEAIACGTPVITYNTGGSPESSESYGVVTREKSAKSIVEAISKSSQIKKQVVELSSTKTVLHYIQLYEES